MSAKIVFDTKGEIPEHLRESASEVDGKFELDASGVLGKNKELLGNNKTLTSENQRLNNEVARLQSSALPEGKVAVDPEIEKFGNAVKNAGLKISEIPTLKTKADELQKQIDSFATEKDVDAVAEAKGYNGKFKAMAKKQGLKFEKVTETVDGKPVDKWFVVGADNAKTDVENFLKTDSFFKEFADTFADEKQEQKGFNFGEQKGAPDNKNIFDRIRSDVKAEAEQAKPVNLDERFGKAA
jgi:hypothetical protein